jgi:hypothetical protein
MKKIVIFIAVALLLAGTLSAQTIRKTSVETRTISGTLSVENGFISVQTDDNTYYTHGFQHLIGFVDGLVEGAHITLEGFVAPAFINSDYQTFISTKMTLNEKDYTLQTPSNNRRIGFNKNIGPDFSQHHQNECSYSRENGRHNRNGGRHYRGDSRRR